MSKKAYTTHEIAKLCEVDPITVARWFDNGLLSGFRTPGGHRRVSQQELNEFLQRQNIPAANDGTGPRIMVVDDDEALLRLLELQFRRAGITRISTHASGMDALLSLATEKPDLLLLDVYMDNLDGREVAQRILAYPELSGIRVAFMTASMTPKLKKELSAFDPVGIFSKPIDVKDVTQSLLSLGGKSPRVYK